MNLPDSVDDPSLLKHEPLYNFVALLSSSCSTPRDLKPFLLSSFVEEMKENRQAAAAAKRWACLVFKDILSGGSSLDVTDKGDGLYKTFFEYQFRLYKGLQLGNTNVACLYVAGVRGRGIDNVKLKVIARHTTQGVDSEDKSKSQDVQHPSHPAGRKKAIRKMNAGSHLTGGGLVMTTVPSDLTSTRTVPTPGCRSRQHGSHSTMHSAPTQQEPSFGPGTAKPRRCSISKRDKKRKAKFQNPPRIAPSFRSENVQEPSKTSVVPATAVPAAKSLTRRSKRTSSRQSCDLLGVENRLDYAKSAHETDSKKHHREATGIPRHQSSLTGFRSNNSDAHANTKGRFGAESPSGGPKHGGENVSTQRIRTSSDIGKTQIMKSGRGLQHRANKRTRRVSTSTPDGGEAHQSMDDSGANVLQGTTNQRSRTGPQSTREDIHMVPNSRMKRSRLEFESTFVRPDENAQIASHESLGADPRHSRPLPHKVCDKHLVPVAHGDKAVSGVPCGTPTLEYADQLLRDAASNAQALMREGVQSNIPDWTEDNGHDAECDNLGGNDQDKANDMNVTTATSAPQKPSVPAPPHIWAQSRQEVCESFEYFRCYHSGVYSKDDIVQGYLLGAYAASRDIFHHGGKLIISHGGGKSEAILDVRRGPRRYQTDQDQKASDRSVRALLKTCKDRRPIVLLADDHYALFPYDLASANYTYVVLGLYWISHAWAECQPIRDEPGRIIRWKFAFQWCEGQGDPWWLPQQEMTGITDPHKSIANPVSSTKSSSHPTNTVGDPSILCEHCQEQSPLIYKQGWMCLNPLCAVFWSVDGEDPKELEYREEFLNLLPQDFERLPDITPPRTMEAPGGVTTTHAFSKGWHCTKCGRLSCRFKWEYWECSNCKLRHAVNGRIRSPKEFWHQRPSKGFLHSLIGKDSGILACRLEPIDLGGRKGFTNRLTFILPDGRGKIHLILGTPLSNGDADDIFQLYQQQASTGELKLRRYPLRIHRARGPLLTNYFSQNSGEPYQYVGGSGQTIPFHDTADCVRRALALIKERSLLALRTDIPFNEVLSAAYMERQKMAFHSDSERGLGPVVASLSLGSAALMHFRRHVDPENPNAKNPNALSLVLRHGDVLIMDGDGVQKYYEHTVVPMNFRIAATARRIGST